MSNLQRCAPSTRARAAPGWTTDSLSNEQMARLDDARPQFQEDQQRQSQDNDTDYRARGSRSTLPLHSVGSAHEQGRLNPTEPLQPVFSTANFIRDQRYEEAFLPY